MPTGLLYIELSVCVGYISRSSVWDILESPIFIALSSF
jgi:hypothetical protein